MYLDSLNDGKIPWRKRWFSDANINGISKQEYRGTNSLILNYVSCKEKYEDNRWYTYKQVKDLGLKLKNAKNKGVPVEFWSVYNYKLKKRFNLKEYTNYINAHPEEKGNFKIFIKTAIVFNGSLVEGLEKAPINKNKSKNIIKPSKYIDNLIKKLGIGYEEFGNRAFYIPKQDKIFLPDKSKFVDEYSYYATQLHEICHATGHPSRLNRILGSKNKKEEAREELIAEISSSFLMQKLNIPTTAEHYDNHNAYIQDWISILSDKPNELFKAITIANGVCDYIERTSKLKIKDYER